ncbi:MAG: hypothetical protein AAFN41_09460 [Planctomycetota bacterium]
MNGGGVAEEADAADDAVDRGVADNGGVDDEDFLLAARVDTRCVAV